MTFISRRDLLKAAAIVAATPVRSAKAFALPEVAAVTPENLTATEMQVLDAIVARLIPTDASGPGATEAMTSHYIDHALGGALGSAKPAYSAGLAALDRYARSSRGAAFTELSPTDQDSVLIDVETGAATGFTGSSAAFFAMVLGHTHQGTFGDPFYGGNANYVGWDLINYPGIRTTVSASDQKSLESKALKPIHKSAYEYQFNKDAERGRVPANPGKVQHGD